MKLKCTKEEQRMSWNLLHFFAFEEAGGRLRISRHSTFVYVDSRSRSIEAESTQYSASTEVCRFSPDRSLWEDDNDNLKMEMTLALFFKMSKRSFERKKKKICHLSATTISAFDTVKSSDDGALWWWCEWRKRKNGTLKAWLWLKKENSKSFTSTASTW